MSADDDLRETITRALTAHRVECVMTAPHCFGWHCLTCGTEMHSWPRRTWSVRTASRAKRCGVEPVVERFTRAEVIDTYGDRCAYCKVGGFEQLDHYVPVAAGGAHVLANVRPTCESCNHKKNVAHGDEFEAAS